MTPAATRAGGRGAGQVHPGTGLPVVVAHGIWDSARRVGPLVRGLRSRGLTDVHALDFVPNWGTARLETLADQLAAFVSRVRAERAVERVDLVGFSMGALVARVFLQLGPGAGQVRRFVSIAGPHRGTLMAYAAPFEGVRQMRPGSPLLRAMGSDVGHLEQVDVHCIYSPFDAMIVPQASAVLDGARSVHRVPVPWHRLMLSDRRVHDLAAALLATGASGASEASGAG